MNIIESTGHKPSDNQRIADGIAECRRQIKRWCDKLHLLQSLRNLPVNVKFVCRQREFCGREETRWYVQLNGQDVCRDFGYKSRGQAMAAATMIKVIRMAREESHE